MSETDARPPSAGRAESIRRNTAFALGIKVTGAVLTGGLTLFLARYLGPADYGVYTLALSIGGLLALPADFGVSRSAGRFIAEGRNDPEAAARVLRQALSLKAGGASLIALVLIAAAGPIANAYEVPALEWPLRIVAVALLGQSFVTLFLVTYEALGRNSLGFRLVLSESALEVSATVVLVLAGAGVIGAAAGRAVGYVFAFLLGLALALPALGRARARRSAESNLGVSRILRYAGTLFAIDAAFVAFAEIDILLIGAFLDPRAAGLFSAPMSVLLVAEFVGLAVAGGVAPRLARTGDEEPNLAAFQAGLRLILIVQFLVVPFIVVWATPIIHLLFGAEYDESADVLRALGPYALMRGPAPLLALGITYLGEARRRIPLALAALGVNATLDVILIPKIGIVAGAIGTDVGFSVFVIGHLIIARRLIRINLRSLGRTLLRTSIASAAMAAVLFSFGTSSALTPFEAIAGAVLAVAIYVGVLVGTREFALSELRAAGTAARTWRR